jgi:hypothetical protein
MTIRQLFVQSEEYNAVDDRAMIAALLPNGTGGGIGSAYGVRSSADLMLTMAGATAGNVSRGAAFIPWGNNIYLLVNDGNASVTFSPAHATMPRIDLVVARVYDAEIGGANQSGSIYAIAGVAASTPAVPATPAGAIPLWQVRYNAGSNAPILTDARGAAMLRRMQSGIVAITTGSTGRFLYQYPTQFAVGTVPGVALNDADSSGTSGTGSAMVGRGVRIIGLEAANCTNTTLAAYVMARQGEEMVRNASFRVSYVAIGV